MKATFKQVIATGLTLTALLGLGGCTQPNAEEIARSDQKIAKEFENRGFTNPTKVGSASFSPDTWAVSLGVCRLEYQISSTGQSWSKVADAATLLQKDQYKHCKTA